MPRQKTVLVTGAGGFIGSHACRVMHDAGWKVYGSVRNVGAIGPQPWFHPISWDLHETLSDVPFDHLDAIIHAATPNDQISKDVTLGVNLSTIGTFHALRLAQEKGARAAVVLSTFQVYGTELTGHITEKTPVSLQSPYGMNHFLAEGVAQYFANGKGMQVASFRPSNVFGEFLLPSVNRWTLVPGCFCREAFTKKTITLLSSGLQRRNFVNAHQVARAAALWLDSEKLASYDVLNVASRLNMSILDVAKLTKTVFERRYGESIELRVMGNEPGEGNHFTVDLSALEQIGQTEFDDQESLAKAILTMFDSLEKSIRER